MNINSPLKHFCFYKSDDFYFIYQNVEFSFPPLEKLKLNYTISIFRTFRSYNSSPLVKSFRERKFSHEAIVIGHWGIWRPFPPPHDHPCLQLSSDKKISLAEAELNIEGEIVRFGKKEAAVIAAYS